MPTNHTYNNKTDLIHQYEVVDDGEFRFNPYDSTYPAGVFEKFMPPEGPLFVDRDIRPLEEIFLAGHRYFLRGRIVSSRAQKVIVGVNAFSLHKVWLNGELLGICNEYYWHTNWATAFLKKGENEIVVEMAMPDRFREMTIMLYNYEQEMTGEINTLSACDNKVDFSNLYFVRDSEWNFTDPTYRFMALPRDKSATEDHYTYTVSYVTRTEKAKICTKSAKLYEPVTLNLDHFRRFEKQQYTALRHIEVNAVFVRNGEKDEEIFYVFPTDFFAEKERIETQLNNCLPYLPEDKRVWYRFCLSETTKINTFEQLPFQQFMYWRVWEYDAALAQIRSGRFDKIQKHTEFDHYVFKSDLDGKDVMYWIRTFHVDTDKRSNKRYPLLISLSTGIFDNHSRWFDGERFQDGVIHADISMRGQTGGGYVGEAAFWDMFHLIEEKYNIDYDRIYLLGFCNGAHSALHLAQSYPHMFAGIYSLSGFPEQTLIRNLRNIPIYTITSDMDGAGAYVHEKVAKKLTPYGNFHEYRLINTQHEFIYDYMMPKKMIDRLMEKKRNLYPNKIDFTTRTNRALRGYWITLGGIKTGAAIASVQAEIMAEDHIRIKVSGTNEMAVTIPPQMCEECITVTINGSDIQVNAVSEQILYFRKKRTWQAIETALSALDYRKGYGILDVYLNSVRIVVPKNADENILDAADNLRTPKTNTNIPELYVTYPVYENDCIPEGIFDHNLIVFSDGNNQINGYNLSDHLPIKCTTEGYRYGDEVYIGPYCVMQIIANPFDSKRSILHISYSSSDMLKKILFLRRFIQPFPMNGYHPYLNNAALIFSGGKYSRIFEWGGKIEEIRGKAD